MSIRLKDGSDLRCLVIAVYFGSLPSYFDLFSRSVASNPEVDFLLVTDQHVECLPSNLRVKKMNLAEFRTAASQALGMQVSVPRAYKVCDFRPAFGHIFADEVLGYSHWGHCDLDVIFGDILGGIPEEAFSEYKKVLIRGCFALYQNSPEVNSLYMQVVPGADYRRVFSTPNPFHFDESAGILRIIQSHDVALWNEDCIFNIEWERYGTRAVGSSPGHHTYVWREGRILEYSSLEAGAYQVREAILIHLMKRPMKRPDFDIDNVREFVIGPNRFFIPEKGWAAKRPVSRLSIAHIWFSMRHQLGRVRRRLTKRGDLRPLA